LRVLLADDHEIVRAGLVSVLGEEETLEVIGEATNGREAVELADQLRPDVVVMDVSMPVMSGAEATRRIKQDLPRTRIVSLSVVEKPDVREEMYQAGAESYILKTAPTEELLAAIRGEEPDSSENPA
jgi:DNA-binding NarL/FixJ family response regulator